MAPAVLSLSRNSLKSAIRGAARKAGYDLRVAQPNLNDFLRSRAIDLVIDVGAHIGGFGQTLRELGYSGQIVSFEPIEANFQMLQVRARKDGKWACHKLAMGDEPGILPISVTQVRTLSSFVPQGPIAKNYPEATIVRTEDVQVATLDSAPLRLDGSSAFLKIDTQGFERNVLAGAPKTMKKVLGVQLEVPVVHFYQNTWTIEEAFAFMRAAGFVLCQATPVGFCGQDPVAIGELDCIFRRKSSID
jgi:FkbM family methyltransferase